MLAAVCLLGSFAWIDRSSITGIEPIAGLAIVAALDRVLNQGSDRVAGLWAAVAVLAGGWPPLLMIVLPIIVLGRRQAKLSKALLIPPILALVAWSIWARRSAPAQVWAAALTLPLTQKMAWRLGVDAVLLALPWSPIAALWAFRSARENLAKPGAVMVTGWLQTAGVALLAGTLIPGMSASAHLPILVALAVTSAAVLDRAWANALSPAARRTLFGIGLILAVSVAAVMVPYGIYVAAAWSYYRPIAIFLTLGATATLLLAIAVAGNGAVKGVVGVFLAIALLIKAAHAGVYVPEWNYRFSEGPWGRAVGQWVPPGWTLYTTMDWGPDFAFATGRTVRRLAHPKLLEYRMGNHPEFILLKAGDFEHWPASAPRLIKVREFEDQYQSVNVLARTEGQFDISNMAEDHD